MSSARPAGIGRTGSRTTPDGCTPELYALFPPAGEADVIHAAAGGRPGSVLELGCGAGRILRPLHALGHDVVGVDESPEMLAYLGDLPGVCATIQTVALARQFDVVLLASNLVTTPDVGKRRAFLAAARRHVTAGGQVLCQLHPAGWFDTAVDSRRDVDGIEYHLHDIVREGTVLSATMTYRIRTREWHHPFRAERLDEAALSAAFADAGLRFDRWLDDTHSWAAAVRAA
jgi:SAM-dependent methyltransferase